MQIDPQTSRSIRDTVAAALAEDVGSGDLTAALIAPAQAARATVVCRQAAVIAGRPWFDEVFRQIDEHLEIRWHKADGDAVEADSVLCELRGNARSLLTGERTALNFLQLLSATATTTARHVAAVAGTGSVILDTRKTLPGLRLAQKYAVRCGGGRNHRSGLYDAVLIKENHIASGGGIESVLQKAISKNPGVMVEIEVESLEELRHALSAGARRVLLDNFSLEDTAAAVRINRDEYGHAAELESSGGKTLEDIARTAATGVDYISVGALTKNVQAVDLSMRVERG